MELWPLSLSLFELILALEQALHNSYFYEMAGPCVLIPKRKTISVSFFLAGLLKGLIINDKREEEGF